MSGPGANGVGGRGLEGRVALITGGARGQGRSHAIVLAEAGADVILVDVADQLATVPYAMSTVDDLAETTRLVAERGRRCVSRVADVRNYEQLSDAIGEGVEELGRLDIVVGNAGIFGFARNTWELTDEQWNVMIDVNLTGVWLTCKASIPHLLAHGDGGSIVVISSTSGFKGVAGTAHYCATKHGILGLMKTLAVELAPHKVRVNAVHPTATATPMIMHDAMQDQIEIALAAGNNVENLLDIEMLEPIEISRAIRWLASDDARYVTGISLPVDAGYMCK
jgi:SDR family mycofactocin-dependent oxidoreductase